MSITASNRRRATALAAALAFSAALSGCISLGPEPPDALLTLTPEPGQIAPANAGASGSAENAIAVLQPESVQRLNVTRVPVQVSPSAIAYLEDATWVDKPAKLFQQLLSETIRARADRLVVGETDLMIPPRTVLSGQLVQMGYDAASQTVTVRFDAILQQAGGEVRTRRFESTRTGIAPDVVAIGPALNETANEVARQVAEWVA
ncbi:ABC-type transport auxiliary lipoprotein family protein [Altericroceibacterium xinjiangense]|uniref:ABC-type transport auxiliary lipoprotein family protein n=1 Tax=Altericroceibacterium xinjiangense TaxID=762261 RepID=UPI000F7E78D0|nr:ABC-type transport auxiliary lipoprotein family protein [Altericroceibacterium xinjiangense]